MKLIRKAGTFFVHIMVIVLSFDGARLVYDILRPYAVLERGYSDAVGGELFAAVFIGMVLYLVLDKAASFICKAILEK